jgi:hypothetical protein
MEHELEAYEEKRVTLTSDTSKSKAAYCFRCEVSLKIKRTGAQASHRKAQAESGRVQRSNGARLKNRSSSEPQKSTSRIWTSTTQQWRN